MSGFFFSYVRGKFMLKPSRYYFVPKELPTKIYPKINAKLSKKAPSTKQGAPRFARRQPLFLPAFLLHFALILG